MIRWRVGKGMAFMPLILTRFSPTVKLYYLWKCSKTFWGHFLLANLCFVTQSNLMNPNWAEENLQTIRTLMERSALYRRALAPIMLSAGAIGVVAAASGLLFHLNSPQEFGELWLGTAIGVIVVAFFIARQQAFKSKEKFWSPPTRRVGQALLPPLLCGMVLGGALILVDDMWEYLPWLPFFWSLFYGLALHAAGFFMPRGVRWFGWIYIIVGCSFLSYFVMYEPDYYFNPHFNPHWLMGFFFGVLHLAYGAYLYLTEKGKRAA
jgi:hypothetical protein